VRGVSGLNYRRAQDFIDAIPTGRWTTFKDVATAAGNERVAQHIGNWLRDGGAGDRNVHRVIRSDRRISDGYRGATDGVPADVLRAYETLVAEGVRFDGSGRAVLRQYFRFADWDPARTSEAVKQGLRPDTLGAQSPAATRAASFALTSPDAIKLGSLVQARELSTGATRIWTLVARQEADPGAGKLSTESPVGSALLGHRAGDEVTVMTPRGRREYIVESVDELPAPSATAE
jgi:alkylated DNA nucleotide flippase Atl1